MAKNATSSSRVFRGRSKRFKCWSIISVVLLVIILAVVIPIAVIFSRRSSTVKGIKSTVLVPLYIYPSPGAWDPLYKVVTDNPNQNFTIILNPSSGPGAAPYVSDEYMLAVRQINAYPNVETVGYVPTGYAARNITAVLSDISVYSGWNTNANASTGTSLAVHGIFFDEAPSGFSDAAATYMKTINQAAKNSSGLLGDRTIIQNPGTIPDARLVDPTTDYSVVFEASYGEFQEKQAALSEVFLNRTRTCYIIHSVPSSLSDGDIQRFSAKASRRSDLFSLTNLDVNFYESFGSRWADYIDLINRDCTSCHSIATHPQLNFTIILNPHNGPGAGSMPDDHYSREIPKLNCQPNVCTVGYVRVDYCRRDMREVCQQIATYAGWSKDFPRSGLGVHGIFFDETPNLYSDNVASYLDSVSQMVKDQPGILGDRLVIHNPGTVPDAGLANPGPDVSTVVEESFANYQSAHLQDRLRRLLRYDHGRCSYMVHSVPRHQVVDLVRELRPRGKYIFVTDLHEDYYCHFGPSWGDFVDAMCLRLE
ncbi:Spherulation-specific family 4 [Amylocarpus encephaloides]|uniref:Spherulation-specific family 4 n=1 Tax=Amylocarpus encephaloides TaxID=45428 RepID=A0A9P7YJG5_9HELO|nr:Spherulation-specific family 4 [Amylocarpus encephaloides]